MAARFFAPVAVLFFLASPASADEIYGFSASASASFGFSAGFGVTLGPGVTPVPYDTPAVPVPIAQPVPVVVPRPAPVPQPAQIVVQPAPIVVYQPAPVVVYQPAPVVIVQQPPPPTIVVRPVAPPPQVVVRPVSVAPQPVGVVSTGAVALHGEIEEVEEDSVDLLAFGRYRNVFGTGDTGGMDLTLRVLLNDSLSLEGKFGYGAGGTEAGGNFEDAPLAFSLVWYPWQRDFPIYFSFGGGVAWSSIWRESDSWDPTFDWGYSEDAWFVGTRTAVGLEFELWDFLLVAAEVEAFYRWNMDEEYAEDGGAGVSIDLGLGVRL